MDDPFRQLPVYSVVVVRIDHSKIPAHPPTQSLGLCMHNPGSTGLGASSITYLSPLTPISHPAHASIPD